MSTRAATYAADVVRREVLSPWLVRLVLGGAGLRGWETTGVPDEWVSLVVPGQFQGRYYTVRAWDGTELTLDVVVHAEGLVTSWVGGDCVGQTVTVSAPKGSFTPPGDAGWLRLVGDLTALPAIARILETTALPARAWVETPDGALEGYLAAAVADAVTWSVPPAGRQTATADLVVALEWPEGPGYLWMAGESAQMRAVRTHVMREVGLPATAYDVMGYWRAQRRPASVDPGPIHARGRAAGLSDAEIWASYDRAQEDQAVRG